MLGDAHEGSHLKNSRHPERRGGLPYADDTDVRKRVQIIRPPSEMGARDRSAWTQYEASAIAYIPGSSSFRAQLAPDIP